MLLLRGQRLLLLVPQLRLLHVQRQRLPIETAITPVLTTPAVVRQGQPSGTALPHVAAEAAWEAREAPVEEAVRAAAADKQTGLWFGSTYRCCQTLIKSLLL